MKTSYDWVTSQPSLCYRRFALLRGQAADHWEARARQPHHPRGAADGRRKREGECNCNIAATTSRQAERERLQAALAKQAASSKESPGGELRHSCGYEVHEHSRATPIQALQRCRRRWLPHTPSVVRGGGTAAQLSTTRRDERLLFGDEVGLLPLAVVEKKPRAGREEQRVTVPRLRRLVGGPRGAGSSRRPQAAAPHQGGEHVPYGPQADKHSSDEKAEIPAGGGPSDRDPCEAHRQRAAKPQDQVPLDGLLCRQSPPLRYILKVAQLAMRPSSLLHSPPTVQAVPMRPLDSANA